MRGSGLGSGLLRSETGRLRLGWRLLAFAVVATAVALLIGLVLPGGVQTGSFAMLSGAVVGGWVALAYDGRAPGALGFAAHSDSLVEALRGLGLGVAMAGVVVGLLATTGLLGWVAEEGSAAAWMYGAGAALGFLLLPAAAEEALLRGYPLQALAEAWGWWPALTVTAGAFGMLHLGNPGVTALGALNVTAAGLLLGVVYLRTGSLWWATGAHLGWNWAHGYLADVPLSGLEVLDAPLYEGRSAGPTWLGGGSFGPEGSVVTTAVLALAVVLCWRARWLEPCEATRALRPLASKAWARGSTESG